MRLPPSAPRTLRKNQSKVSRNPPPIRKPIDGWQPISDRKIRVGLVGYGVCQFAAAFGFQDHPNVEVVAVSDLIPDRCAGLAKAAAVRRRIRRSKNW